MATPTFTTLKTYCGLRSQATFGTGLSVEDTDFAVLLNEGLRDVYEISGGRIKRVASATAWTTAQTATGQVAGILLEIVEVVDVFASTTSGSTGYSSGDTKLDQVDIDKLEWYRRSNLTGTYDRPQLFALTTKATVTPGSVNLLQLDYWPSVTGFYLPTHYISQYAEIDSATVTTPDLNETEAYDGALLTAARIAQLTNHPELVPGIIADISERTSKLLERKMRALMQGAKMVNESAH